MFRLIVRFLVCDIYSHFPWELHSGRQIDVVIMNALS